MNARRKLKNFQVCFAILVRENSLAPKPEAEATC